jgi:hypothetical protein
MATRTPMSKIPMEPPIEPPMIGPKGSCCCDGAAVIVGENEEVGGAMELVLEMTGATSGESRSQAKLSNTLHPSTWTYLP